MKTEIKVRNFATSFGVFENGKFINSSSWQEMIDQATEIANEGNNICSIATLKFVGTDENPIAVEGVVVMKFHKMGDYVYITNALD